MKWKTKALLGAGICAGLGDVAASLLGMSTRVAYEGNPVASVLYVGNGTLGMLAGKAAPFILVGLLAMHQELRRGLNLYLLAILCVNLFAFVDDLVVVFA